MWFSNQRDEGAEYPELFGPIFPTAFALVLSAVSARLTTTRTKTDVPFTSADLRSVYQDDFEKYTAPRHPGKYLHNIGRFYSNAHPIAAVASTSALSCAALDAAVREYEEDENTETDGEHGEHAVVPSCIPFHSIYGFLSAILLSAMQVK
ncbi:hypothetical protein B0H13DRAFT_2261368 [Mycena leptocephala]|nr:hypothetical protein B0H13DRAFT_2261368 [Mycena leptocephala]